MAHIIASVHDYNPGSSYGSDVVSRVTLAAEHGEPRRGLPPYSVIVAGAALLACRPQIESGAPPDPVVSKEPNGAAPAPLTEIRQATLEIMGQAAVFVALERG
jgi:hypothetical protein